MYQQPEREHNYSRERMRRELLQKSYEAEKRKKAKKRKNHIGIVITILVVLVLVAGGVLVKLWLDTNPFKVPGEITYDESLTEDEKNTLAELFKDYVGEDAPKMLDHNVTFSAETTFEKKEKADNLLLINLEVPTVSFYSDQLNVITSEANTDKVTWVAFEKLIN